MEGSQSMGTSVFDSECAQSEFALPAAKQGRTHNLMNLAV